MKHFRVKFGFKNDDFISIDETELSKALRAQIKGSVAVFKEGSIAGNLITMILPDYQKDMGWNRDYQLTGEDYDEIGKKRQLSYTSLIENTKREIQGLPPATETKQITSGMTRIGDLMK